ncbi:VWA domain-containing protein [Myxococcota bacterium]|nr:VWA domain-containing protein [Myxococcota bacterium]
MNLGLLAPLALALGALALGPILAHLAQQRPSERVPFGAMMLLRRMVKRLEKRRRLKDRALLALRVLALLFAVLAAAQPQLSWPGDPAAIGAFGRVVLIVDDSLSMSQRDAGGTLLTRARDEALAALEQLPPGTLCGLVLIGGEARQLTPTLTAELGLIRDALVNLQPSYGRTDLEGGLREARALLAGERGEVLVYTDEAGPTTISEAQGELARLVERGGVVLPRPTRNDPPANLTVLDARYGDGLEGGSVTLRVANYGSVDVEAPVTVGLPDGSEITAFVELPAGGEAEERVTVPPTVPGGVAWARVMDTDLEADNTRYFHLPRVGASRVMVVDGDPGATPVRSEVYFLERALAPWGGARGGVLPQVVAPSGLAALSAEEHQVVFLANVADPSPWAGKLLDFVRGGGGVIFSAGDNLTAERYNEPLRALMPAPLERPRDLIDLTASGGVPLELPDPSLELFEAFAEEGRQAFRRVTTRRVMGLGAFTETGWTETSQDGVRVLMRFEGGAPALVERRIGRGRVLLWTSSFDLGWGSAPLQAVFLPFTQRLVAYLGGESAGGAARAEGVVGEVTSLRLPFGGLTLRLTGPDGADVPMETAQGEQTELSFLPRLPGAYTVQVGDEPPVALIAVNTPAEESDVRAPQPLTAATAAIDPALTERHVRLGPWALGLAITCLLAQALVARRESS